VEFDHSLIDTMIPNPIHITSIRKNESFGMFIFLNKKFDEISQTSIKLKWYDSLKGKTI